MWDATVGFFSHLVSLSNPIWWYYPLCAVAAVVYKATKFDTPRDIARAALHFFLSVSAGMLILGWAFYLIITFF